MRQLAALSDIEFEHLVADLLRAHTGRAYERFAAGSDGGVDLRWTNGRTEIVQCKHYARSSFSQLLASAKEEPRKLSELSPKPDTYRFVTSQSLTVSQKDKLITALEGWIDKPEMIWGLESIVDLLDAHPEVERHHVKLWLSSSNQLEQLLNAGTLNRSNDLIERIKYSLPRYVQTARFYDARSLLVDQGVCLIAGEPGIGKTILGQMLLLDSANHGFESFYVSQDINEAWEALADRPQAFYYDDFLGRIGLSGLSKNEDQRLVDLIARANREPESTRLILTTREYILRHAVHLYDTLDRAELDHRRFLLALEDYSRYERGLVLYNHLYHSPAMKAEWISEIVESRSYLEIIDHPNYSPRLIEFITGLAKPRELKHIDGDWKQFALRSLDHPEEIWKRAFDVDLTELQRAMLICIVSLGAEVEIELYRLAVHSYCGAASIPFLDSEFEHSLNVLELSFLSFGSRSKTPTADIANPSISDFVLNLISENPRMLTAILDGAAFFAQARQLVEVGSSNEAQGFRGRLARLLSQERPRLARALLRTFASSAIGFEDGRASTSTPEERLRLLFDHCEDLLVEKDLGDWPAQITAALQEQWSEEGIVGADSVQLYASCARLFTSDSTRKLGETLKRILSRSPVLAADYELLSALWSTAPELFKPGEEVRLRNAFADYADSTLARGRVDEGEIRAIVRVARRMQIRLDDVDLHEAQHRAQKRRVEEANRTSRRLLAREEATGAHWSRLLRRRNTSTPIEASPGDALGQDTNLREMFERLGSWPDQR